jgi:hypothetical protein
MSVSILCNWSGVKAEKKRDRSSYEKARSQNPEYKARRKAYEKARSQNPEYKARRKAYEKAYRQTPDYKAKRDAYQKAYRSKNREKINAAKLEWRKANPDKVKAISKKQSESKRKKKALDFAAWEKANPEKAERVRKLRALRRFDKREYESVRKSQWYLENRSRLLEKQKSYTASIKATKNFFQINAAIAALKNAGN